MKTNYTISHSNFKKSFRFFPGRALLFLFLFMGAATGLYAQITVTIGTGTSTQSYAPINRYYNNSASEMIYTGTEIGTDGLITEIAFQKGSGSNTVTIDNVSIYMKTTTATTVGSTTSTTGYTLVYQGAFPNDNTGWMGVILDTPFLYENTSDNVSILIVMGYQAYTSSRPYYMYTSGASSQTSYYQDDDYAWSESSNMTTTSNRPNVQFTMVSSDPCTAPTDQPTGLTLSNQTSTSISGSFTAASSAPDSYLVLRSSSTTLTEDPVDGTIYPIGASLGGATVIQKNGNTTFTDSGLTANTSYYYFVYSYNANCTGGPIYYTMAAPSETANTTTDPTTLVGAANITSTSATIVWIASEDGGGVNPITYALDIATDSGFSTIVDSYTGLTDVTQDLTGLVDGTTYYVRVMIEVEGTYSTGSFTAMDDRTPITVTGFNEDVIANGAGSASVTTTNAVDAADYSFFAAGFNPSGTTYTSGLPANRVLTSVAAPAGSHYFLAPYNEDNDLRLGMDGNTGTLTLTNPLPLTEIYLGVTGGSGAASFTAVVTYDDATTDTFTGLSAPDWFNNNNYIINIGARVNRTNNSVSTNSGGPRIYPVTISVPVANQLKNVVSIGFTSTTGVTSGDNVLNVFAVSGKISAACNGTPAPGTASLSASTGGVGTTFTASATNVSSSSGILYQWQVSEDGTTWTDITGATTVSATITAETAIGTYYYQLVTTCTNTSEINYSNAVTFTTTPCTPSYSITGSNWRITDFSIEEVSFSDTSIAYNDHDQTNLVIPTLIIGSTYTFDVTTTGWLSVGVAVDFDQSGGFSEANESLALPVYIAASPNTYVLSVTIPANVNPGSYTMRIWCREANAGAGTSACGSYTYGSWVDYTLIVDNTAAVASVKKAVALNYYPNPVSGALTLNSDTVITSVDVYAVTGQKIITESTNATLVSVDMKNVAKGVYFVTVGFEGTEPQTIRIVKQ